ncbi:hypothetical protein OR221_0460, partial [Microbacterium laevaniformans OR221]
MSKMQYTTIFHSFAIIIFVSTQNAEAVTCLWP